MMATIVRAVLALLLCGGALFTVGLLMALAGYIMEELDRRKGV